MSALRPERATRERPAAQAPRRRDRSGFILIDVLVAVGVLAVLGALLPASIVATRQSVERSEAWFHARLVAETLIARELSGTIRSGIRNGRLDGRRWTISSRPNNRLPSAAPLQSRRLLDVRLTVEVSATETLVVNTLRVGVAP